MNFMIVGGGCYGAFYVKQLMQGRERGLVLFDEIHVVDHDLSCLVMQRHRHYLGQGLVFVHEDWKTFLTRYFKTQTEKTTPVEDLYVPPCLAPHLLWESFETLFCSEAPLFRFEHSSITVSMETPFESRLPNESVALSYATWLCPVHCIEPGQCPHTRDVRDWDMKETVLNRISNDRKMDQVHVFQCLHHAMGVAVIPVREIVNEYLLMKKNLLAKPNSHFAFATVSACHGLISFIESRHV